MKVYRLTLDIVAKDEKQIQEMVDKIETSKDFVIADAVLNEGRITAGDAFGGMFDAFQPELKKRPQFIKPETRKESEGG